MNTWACGILIAVALSVQAAADQRAPLVGQHRSHRGTPVLVCEYAGARARFEIISQSGDCAPYLLVQ